MLRLFLIFFLIGINLYSHSQVSDIVSVKKKNGRTIKNFFEGSSIFFQKNDGEYIQGPIAKIHHDSIYVKLYVIQKGLSPFGTYLYDTVNTYLVNTNYKDIRRISVYHHGWIRQKVGLLMMLGGAGYAALNLLNGSFFNLPITDKKNVKTLGISAGAFAAGFINNKFFAANSFSKRKDQIMYISIN